MEEAEVTDLPNRKKNRLPEYDYSQNGAYFVTICTENRKCLLSCIVGATNGRPYNIDCDSADERLCYEKDWPEYLAKIFS